MRASADPLSPDYKPEMFGATICLDGCRVEQVWYADEEAGQIIAARIDANGDVMHVNGEVLFDTLRGHVRIYPPAAATEQCRPERTQSGATPGSRS